MATATEEALSIERRRETRVAVQIPMLVRCMGRNGRSFEERTVAQNLSSGGAAFTTLNPLDMGSKVLISVPASSSGQPDTEFSTKAQVVYSKSDSATQEITIGVKFIGRRFQRSAVSLWALDLPWGLNRAKKIFWVP